MTLHKRALFGTVLGLAVVCTGCGTTASAKPLLPRYAYKSPAIQMGYEFAISAGGDALRQLPCYCSCAALGHTHLRDCFISDEGVFDSHAAGCEVCVDEALDAKRMLSQGTSLKDIRAFIDAKYSTIGPGTNTPPVL